MFLYQARGFLIFVCNTQKKNNMRTAMWNVLYFVSLKIDGCME